MKRFTERALDAKLKAMTPPMVFHPDKPPRLYQKATFLLTCKYPGYYIIYDMGLGKTLVSLYTYDWRRRADQVKRLLVLVPLSTLIGDWRDESEETLPHLRFAGLSAGVPAAARKEMIEGDADIVCMTYAAMQRAVCDTKNNKRTINPTKLKHFCKRFGMIVCDESTFVGAKDSLSHRIIWQTRKHIDYRLLLTGTPFGKDPVTAWGQMRLVDGGESLGETKGLFHDAFYTTRQHEWTGFPEYIFDDKKKGKLRRMMKNKSIRYETDEVLADMPPIQFAVRRIPQDPVAAAHHHRVKKDLEETRDYRLVENSWHRMRQTCSGWMGYRDEDENKKKILFKLNHKLDQLISDLHEMPEGRKAIVFNEYTISGAMIATRLKAEKIPFVRIYGDAKDKEGLARRFKRDPKVKVLLGQNAAVSYGLNLQMANYVMFYETPVDPKVRHQAWKRAHRGGQKRTVFVYDYITEDTIEEEIKEAVDAGINLMDSIINRKKK